MYHLFAYMRLLDIQRILGRSMLPERARRLTEAIYLLAVVAIAALMLGTWIVSN